MIQTWNLIIDLQIIEGKYGWKYLKGLMNI